MFQDNVEGGEPIAPEATSEVETPTEPTAE